MCILIHISSWKFTDEEYEFNYIIVALCNYNNFYYIIIK